MRPEWHSGPFAALSERELEVLGVLASDKTDREIARCLGIGERTVRAHVGRIILKLGAAVAFVEWNARENARRCGGSCMAEQPMVELRTMAPHLS
ncbi:helix-turn-helix transcriptional regulator [Saccharothrix sp. 6-C]|uniref:helix-turn-helix domain-containing protein n=1 Tax=Saccharothrix sp. 6-C TaxID=2781735 RepID=UPI0019171D81|nr:helix-turn-helix transcriptional regulator [Saccharothrix sp. 6-C]QQQ74076.1 helix-turn-helix transcriptional regulator [Saccharothrix sp. 6-C]